MSNDEHKICPFCGSDDIYMEETLNRERTHYECWSACENCKARGPMTLDAGLDPSAWNRRASQPSPVTLVEALREALRKYGSHGVMPDDTCAVDAGLPCDCGFEAALSHLGETHETRKPHETEKRDGWRSMDSAPRDGTLVLIAAHDNGDSSQPTHVLIAKFDGEDWRQDDSEFTETWPPVLWQPLPPAPTSAPVGETGRKG